jgi:hypothetical protein
MAMRAAANQNGLVQRFGRVQTLEVDAAVCQIRFSVLLKGETEAITGQASYHIFESSGERSIEIQAISVSREWLQQAIGLLQEQKGTFRFPLHGILGKIIAMIL